MKGLTIVNTDNKLILTVDKNNFTEEVLLELYKVARLQYLISKADFDESILGYGGNKKRLGGGITNQDFQNLKNKKYL